MKHFIKRVKSWAKIVRNFNTLSYLKTLLLLAFFRIPIEILKNRGATPNLILSIKYVGGLILNYPLSDLPRFYDLFGVLPSQSYSENYRKKYLKKIEFNKEDVVVDIGAHLGRFSIPVYFGKKNLRIFAYEPDPINFICLKRSARANKFSKKNFRVFNLAVYGKEGAVDFSPGVQTSTGSVLGAGFFLEASKPRKIPVKSTTINMIFKKNKIQTCRILKIDCEGSEYPIFYTTKDNIFKKIKTIFLEAHSTKENTPLKLISFLKKKGFEVRGQKTSNRTWELYCENKNI